MRFVLGLDGHLKFEPKFLIAWKFGAPPVIKYTFEIEPKWGPQHHGGRGWYLNMLRSIIPYEEASLHRSVLLSKLLVMLGMSQMNFLHMMIWNKHNK
jgi:hypothetical protein